MLIKLKVDRRNRINQEPQHQRSQSQPENRTQHRRNTRGRTRLYQTRPVAPPLSTRLPPSLSSTPLQTRSGNLSPINTTFDFNTQTRSPTPGTPKSPASPEVRERSLSPIANQRQYQQDLLTGSSPYTLGNEEIVYRAIAGSSRNNQDLINFDNSDRLIIGPGSEIGDDEIQSDNTIADEQENENNFQYNLDNILPEYNNIINNNQEDDYNFEINNQDGNNSPSGESSESSDSQEENEESEEEMAMLVKPPKFSATSQEDPSEWFDDYELATNANGWNDERKKNAMGAYLKKGAREWYLEWATINDAHDWAALRRAFTAKYCNDDFHEQWLDELRGLKQRKGESVEDYYYSVKRMANRAGIDGVATLPYFIRGLLPEIRAVVKTHAPVNLAAALTKAKQYEQGKGEIKKHKKKYKRYESSSDSSDSSESEDEKSRRKRKEQKKKKNKKPNSDEELDELTKRFEKLQINLMQQVSNMTKNFERQNRGGNNREVYPKNNNFNNNNNLPRRCYNCNEVGHFARDCLSEKKQHQFGKNISYVEYDNESDDGEYEIYEAIRNKPNTRSTSLRKPGRPPKTPAPPKVQFNPEVKYKEPEILVDFEEDPFDETINDIEMKDDPPKKIIKPKVQRTKRQPSIIDQLTSYDIADDILNSPANVKIGQMLQYPDQKRNLTKILKRSATPSNYVETGEEKRTTAAKCYVRIKGNPVAAVLDSGAAVSIITEKLRRQLGLRTETPSNIIVITANGTKQRALGEIHSVGIAVKNLLIPMKLRVIDSTESNLLLGTDFFEKTQAQWDFKTCNIKLRYEGQEVDVETTHSDHINTNQISNNEYDDEYEDDNDIQNDLEYELEEEEGLQELESFQSECICPQHNDKLPRHMVEENPAIFFTNCEREQTKENNEDEKPISKQQGILNEQQTNETDKLFLDNIDVFAENISEEGQTIELTQTHIVEHEIKTNDAEPIKQRPYRIAPSENQFVKNELDAMLDKGIIRESTSPWASPIVIVPKKNNKKRICIDYRRLNKVTEKDVYPLPIIDDILEMFDGAKWFSTLDLASGYWQVAVKEEDKRKTAFVTKHGLYEFNVMPFGLCNAPATFQRLMDKVLSRFIGKFLVVYLDDVTIYSQTFDEHMTHLKTVFKTLRKAQLKLNRDKCHFFLHSIKFLGHEITRQGILPDEEKIDKVKNFPTPHNLRTLRGFIGLASYYRKFINKFSDIAKPLNKLLQKDEPFVWSKEQRKAFELLKHHLITAPILQHPKYDKPFYLHTDASSFGLGAVLAQKDEENKREFAIAYASRSLNTAEKNYSATDLECLAVIWAVEYFRHYFGTDHFYVVTDHSALKWLHTSELKGRRARWILRLEPYNYTIIHRAGRKHNNADSLSRLPQSD